MYEDWIQCLKGLPRDGEQIEFLLDCRDVPMRGTYTRQAFHSHWAEYGPDHVRCWRNLAPEHDLATPAGISPHWLSPASQVTTIVDIPGLQTE